MDMKPGRIVISKAGRDKGKLFVITSMDQPGYVRISDGDLRKLEKPKKKKIKHLQATIKEIKCFSECLNDFRSISNAQLRKMLFALAESLK